jgi:hypothetical protein
MAGFYTRLAFILERIVFLWDKGVIMNKKPKYSVDEIRKITVRIAYFLSKPTPYIYYFQDKCWN